MGIIHTVEEDYRLIGHIMPVLLEMPNSIGRYVFSPFSLKLGIMVGIVTVILCSLNIDSVVELEFLMLAIINVFCFLKNSV